MGEQISKKEANPIVAAILNFLFGGIGYYMIGQKTKGMWGTIIFFAIYIIGIVTAICCCLICGCIMFCCFFLLVGWMGPGYLWFFVMDI